MFGLPRLHLVWIVLIAMPQVVQRISNRKCPGIGLPLPHMCELVANQWRRRADRRMHNDRPAQRHCCRRSAHSREKAGHSRQPTGLAQRDAVRQRLRRHRNARTRRANQALKHNRVPRFDALTPRRPNAPTPFASLPGSHQHLPVRPHKNTHRTVLVRAEYTRAIGLELSDDARVRMTIMVPATSRN